MSPGDALLGGNGSDGCCVRGVAGPAYGLTLNASSGSPLDCITPFSQVGSAPRPAPVLEGSAFERYFTAATGFFASPGRKSSCFISAL